MLDNELINMIGSEAGEMSIHHNSSKLNKMRTDNQLIIHSLEAATPQLHHIREQTIPEYCKHTLAFLNKFPDNAANQGLISSFLFQTSLVPKKAQ
jgi:hypothetical protein